MGLPTGWEFPPEACGALWEVNKAREPCAGIGRDFVLFAFKDSFIQKVEL